MAASDTPAIVSLDEPTLEFRQIPDEKGNVYVLISVPCNLYRFVILNIQKLCDSIQVDRLSAYFISFLFLDLIFPKSA
jgi:hypothetical protein